MKHEESKIQAKIVKALQDIGIFCFMVPNDAAGSNSVRQMQMISMGLRAGVSDLVVWLPIQDARTGLESIEHVYMEVKTLDGKLSASQAKFQSRCEKYGVKYIVVRSPEEAVNYVNEVLLSKC